MAYQTILGIDPGKTNCAYSVVRFTLNPFRYKIMRCGMFKHPVQNVVGTEVVERFEAFKQEVAEIRSRYTIHSVLAERFQTRGGQSMGTTIEVVSMMLALLASPELGFKRVQFVTAAQWKNQWNRKNNLKALYECMPIPPHPIDATGIAMYGISQEFSEEESFKALNNVPELVGQLLRSFRDNNPTAPNHTQERKKNDNVQQPRRKT